MSIARALVVAAREAAHRLAVTDAAKRNAALEAIAVALEAESAAILAANAEDILRAEQTDLAPATLARLRLDTHKLHEMAAQVRAVAALDDPLGRVLAATELDAAGGTAPGGLHLEKVSVPLGVLAVIFEARPDAVTQIAALALKSGNAALLKPGSEVERTAAVLIAAMRRALAQTGLPADALTLVAGREQTHELLALHTLIDLAIPRGSRQLVEFVQDNTRIPVLGHAEGVCHVYVDKHADPALALRIILDAKCDYPAACNAAETVLVHAARAPHFIPQLAAALAERNVVLRGDDAVRELVPSALAVADWHTEFGALELAVGVVSSLADAIAHIHRHGSAHTDAIITEDAITAEQFLREVDSAGVFWNASTRFADGFRYGFGAEVGVSTSKLHARGPVGLEGLTTYKYLLRGQGHTAADYRGTHARDFTHRRL